MRLTTTDHDRGAAGSTYVYPVVSRRAGGVSIGVNLNPNRACNWRCVYCQVPGLVRGAGPPIDLELLERELRALLGAVLSEGWLERHAPAGARRLNDVAFSGDGEPTTSPDFEAAARRVRALCEELGLRGRVKLVLITNGSRIQDGAVQRGIAELAAFGGELWFKLDAGTPAGRARMGAVPVPDERVLASLLRAAELCPTRIQTMCLSIDGEPPAESEVEAWLALLAKARRRGARLVDVMLYGLERPSHQPEAPRLSKLDPAWIEALAERVRALGILARVAP